MVVSKAQFDRKYRGRCDEPRLREKAHTREADAIAAARRRLPIFRCQAAPRSTMSGVDGSDMLGSPGEGVRPRLCRGTPSVSTEAVAEIGRERTRLQARKTVKVLKLP